VTAKRLAEIRIYRRDGIRWMRLNGWPEIFEVLCTNCHAIHHFEDGYENAEPPISNN
jgi:hypothetical protein